MGDSIFIHTFAAYYGLAVSFMLFRDDVSTPKESSCYHSDISAMIGKEKLYHKISYFKNSQISRN